MNKCCQKNGNQQNPTGRPLPSRYARTFHQRSRYVTNDIGRKQVVLACRPGSVIKDFYGNAYAVELSGSLRLQVAP